MFTYWFMLGTTGLLAFSGRATAHRREALPLIVLIAGFFIAVIGLRYQIGADWFAYIRMYRQIAILDFGDALTFTDPAYGLLNWLVARIGLEVWTVNFACAVLFTVGLFRFAFTLPNPWLGIVAAVPYMVVVVAMGYTRQAVALGAVMIALPYIREGSLAKFVLWAIVATAFHKTAILVIPIAVIAYDRNRTLTFLIAGLLAPVLYYVFVSAQIDSLVQTYIDNVYGSQGALIRVIMCAIPATIYLTNMRRFDLTSAERKLWRNFAVVALLFLPALALSDASTAIDRLALYCLPLQVFVAAWLPILFSGRRRSNALVVLLVTTYSATVLFVWLNFAVHSEAWLPYKFYPSEVWFA